MAWRFFNNGTTESVSSIVSKPSLVTKVYLPRQILVLSSTLSNLMSSMLEFLVLVPIIFVLLGNLHLTVLLFPLVHLLYFWFVYGVGLFLSAFFVYFRDLDHIWRVLLNILFFCSPIIYPISIVPDRLMPYYQLNPVTRFIVIYREVMVAGNLPSAESLVIIIGFCVIIYFAGRFVFSKLQRRFAEEV